MHIIGIDPNSFRLQIMLVSCMEQVHDTSKWFALDELAIFSPLEKQKQFLKKNCHHII